MDDTVTRAAIFTFAAPVIVGLIQVIKGMIPDRFHKYSVLLSLLFGQIVAWGAMSAVPYPPQAWILTLLTGLATGLAASGIYSGAQAIGRE